MASSNPADAFKGYTWETHTIPFSVYKTGVDKKNYDLNPDHQRGVVHNKEWQKEIIRSACQFNDIPPVRFHTQYNADGTQRYESLDGKQRSMAIVEFMNDKFTVHFPEWGNETEKKYSELTLAQKQFIDNRTLDVKVTRSSLDEDEISQFFQRAQQTKITQLGEHLNSDIGSKKREIAFEVLRDRSITDIITIINPKNSRFSHLEIIARLLYCYDKDNHNGLFDTAPYKIKRWWNKKDVPDIDTNELKKTITLLLNIINNSKLSYKSSKTTYLPVFWYIMNHSTKIDKLIQYISKDNFVWEHVQNGGQGASHVRYEQLKSKIQ